MRFWTRQHEAVWDELQKTGQYIVKKEYIEAKNDTHFLNSIWNCMNGTQKLQENILISQKI